MKNLIIVMVLFTLALSTQAQNTLFQHRGLIIDQGGAVLNGAHDLILLVHSDPSQPTQVGNAYSVSDVFVVNGVFSTNIDLGTMPFTQFEGLFLEVRYRPTGSSGAYSIAANREPLEPSPFALRAHFATRAAFALTADSVQGIYPSQIVQNNQTGTPQPGIEINVGGGVSGWALNSGSNFNIGWVSVLSAPYDNLFVGRNAGTSSSQAYLGNTFVGTSAGEANTDGTQNTFVGRSAGERNTGSYNSFLGNYAGAGNRLGSSNSFFGQAAGAINDTGSDNVFVGRSAGLNSVTGSFNTLIGSTSGAYSAESTGNTFLGYLTGRSIARESYNTLIGFSSDARKGVTNSTAIGSRSRVDVSNAVVIGSVTGINGAEATSKVGIGTVSPANALQVVDPGNTGLRVQTNTKGGSVASFGGNGSLTVDAPNLPGGRITVQENGNVGIGNTQPAARVHVNGDVRVEDGDILGLGGNGLVLKNRYGQCFRLEVNQSSQLVIKGIFCP